MKIIQHLRTGFNKEIGTLKTTQVEIKMTLKINYYNQKQQRIFHYYNLKTQEKALQVAKMRQKIEQQDLSKGSREKIKYMKKFRKPGKGTCVHVVQHQKLNISVINIDEGE